MRIVHISDLHFGKHNAALKDDLLGRMKKLRPTVIVCTGDLIDTPDEYLVRQAETYLEELKNTCEPASPEDPCILFVPGNHDYSEHGFLWKSRKPIDRIVRAHENDYYFAGENVWIFGFDSASAGPVGGGGVARDEDISRFHARYRELEDKQPEFRRAFKIIALHHHPLPVNWDTDFTQRWLTLTNAGTFLSAALIRRVDLVLHGHEHLEARAHLRSTLGGDGEHEVMVLSLGATLRSVENPNRNWFGLITVERGHVAAAHYPSVGQVFSEDGQTIEIRSQAERAAAAFNEFRKHSGHAYREVASITTVTPDGDALRTVECEGLEVLVDGNSRARSHEFVLPYTSGYVDCLTAEGRGWDPSITPIPRGTRQNNFKATIDFGRTFPIGKPVSYQYSWYAVNSFAMNERQFDFLYSHKPIRDDDVEFTHFVVADPIEDLTVIVRFPDRNALAGQPQIRVTQMSPDGNQGSRGWIRRPEIELRLNEQRALRYYESLNTAALRISRPATGLSFGIEWHVPELPKRTRPPKAQTAHGQIMEMQKIWEKEAPTEQQRVQLGELFARLVGATRQLIAPEWKAPLEISILNFVRQPRRCKLRVLAASSIGDTALELKYPKFELDYGDGIAGRAIKANELRVYALDDDDNEEPDYYTRCDETVHRVILALPLQNPCDRDDDPYAVLSIASDRFDCPLALAGVPEGPAPAPLLEQFHETLNLEVLQSLTKIFLP
jgi:3',5'-cyclic AMP phosphodiesterase CpdA